MPSFTTSEIIALTAIIISGITSVLTLYYNARNNRASIESKRFEIVLDERLKSFRALYSAVSKFNSAYRAYHGFLSEYDDLNDVNDVDWLNQSYKAKSKAYYDSMNELKRTYYNSRIFLPPHIDNLMRDYMREVVDNHIGYKILGEETGNDYGYYTNTNEATIEAIRYHEEQIAQEIHRFIGFR